MANSHFQSCLMANPLLWELFLRHRHIGELLMEDSLRSWVALLLLPRFDFLWSFARTRGKILLIQNLWPDGISWYFDVSLSQNLRITRPRNWLAGTKGSPSIILTCFRIPWSMKITLKISKYLRLKIDKKKSQKFKNWHFSSKNSSNKKGDLHYLAKIWTNFLDFFVHAKDWQSFYQRFKHWFLARKFIHFRI